MKEPLVHESYRALQSQVNALAKGTNPIVYFPVGTKVIPDLPDNTDMCLVEGTDTGAGIYFFNRQHVTEEEIQNAVNIGQHGLLLSFVQTKQQAAQGVPALIVARDAEGYEIKSAVVDAKNRRAVFLQKKVFEAQFPDATVILENVQNVLVERLYEHAAATTSN
jgi:hypothetical protein